MEFQLDGIKFEDLSYEGDVIIELPAHYNLLPPSERSEALNSPRRRRLIVATGRDHREGDVTIVTGRGTIITLSPERMRLPPGDVVPRDSGTSIEFLENGERIMATEII